MWKVLSFALFFVISVKTDSEIVIDLNRGTPGTAWVFKDDIPDDIPTFSDYQPPRRPPTDKKRISEIKCNEYTQRVTRTVNGLALTVDPIPIKIHTQGCVYWTALIVGGSETAVGEFPHMAAVGFRDGNGGISWDCGGSLISEQYVLTAAHCTTSRYGNAFVVRLGEHNLKSKENGAHPVDYYIRDIIKHPEYRPPAKYNDIALLKLSRTVTFTRTIQPACVWTKDSITTSKAVATGWGHTDNGHNPSDVLLKVVLNIIDQRTCNRFYYSNRGTRALARGIVESQICAGELEGGRDTCRGDSGGPLQIISSSDNPCMHHIIGITSFGKHCGQPNAPGVYTRVSSYVSWIESIVWLR